MLLTCLFLVISPVAIRLEVEPLGRGPQGVVVAVAVQVAPEDRGKLGERVSFSIRFTQLAEVKDAGTGVASLAPDGTFLLFREWPVGEGEVTLELLSLDGQYRGLVSRLVKVPLVENVFVPGEDAPSDAVALLPAPSPEQAVRFLPPQPGTAVGTVLLRLEAPRTTSEVRFFQGEELLLTKNRPPWEVALSLGVSPGKTLVRAEAFGADGQLLGEDVIMINEPGDHLAVQILLREVGVGSQRQRVTVSVSPPGMEEEVHLQLDDRPLARWVSCPCVVELPMETLNGGRVLVAEARGRGKRGEAVLLLDSGILQESVRVEVVELPVVVLDNSGKLVNDLSLEDFQVWEDGRQVQLSSLARSEDQALSLGLAVDVSGSMQKDFPLVQKAVAGFLGQFLRSGDRYFLGVFSWEFKLLVPWAFDPRFSADRLARVPVEGGTSLHDAIIKALQEFSGRKGPKGLVLLTDGEDTASRTGWEGAWRFARTFRTPIFPVGIRVSRLDFLLRRRLQDLASSTGGEAFFVGQASELPQVYRRIGEQLRSQYLLVYQSPSQEATSRFRTVTVKVARPNVTVRTIAGYFPPL